MKPVPTYSNTSLALLALLIAACSLAGCELNDPCDPGQTYEFGLCIPPPVDEDAEGGAGGGGAACEDLEIEGEPNPGAACTEGGDECTGGTQCGAPDFPQCVALCGECDAFYESCPDGLTCTDFGRAFLCF